MIRLPAEMAMIGVMNCVVEARCHMCRALAKLEERLAFLVHRLGVSFALDQIALHLLQHGHFALDRVLCGRSGVLSVVAASSIVNFVCLIASLSSVHAAHDLLADIVVVPGVERSQAVLVSD